jgi:hypothetical protein
MRGWACSGQPSRRLHVSVLGASRIIRCPHCNSIRPDGIVTESWCAVRTLLPHLKTHAGVVA